MLDSLVRVSRRVLRVPKAVASPTGIGPRRGHEAHNANVRRPVEGVNRTTNSGPGPVTAPGPLTSVYHGARLRRPRRTRSRGARARVMRTRAHESCKKTCGLIPCVYRRAAGRATGGLTRAVLPATRQSPHPGRRPTPSGSRRSTRGEVHDDPRRTSTHGSVAAREPRGPAGHRPPTRSQRR